MYISLDLEVIYFEILLQKAQQFISRPNASVNSSCAHPPPGNCGVFAHIVSPGGRALANPRATPGLLTPRGF